MPELIQPYVAPVTDSLQSLSLDLLVIGGIVALLYFFGVWRGKPGLSALFFSLPLAAFAFSIFPRLADLTFFGSSPRAVAAARLVFFGILVAIMYFILVRIVYAYSAPSKVTRWFDLGLLSATGGVLCIAFFFHPLELSALYTFGPFIQKYVAPPTHLFSLLVVSLIAFFIAVRK